MEDHESNNTRFASTALELLESLAVLLAALPVPINLPSMINGTPDVPMVESVYASIGLAGEQITGMAAASLKTTALLWIATFEAIVSYNRYRTAWSRDVVQLLLDTTAASMVNAAEHLAAFLRPNPPKRRRK